MATIEVNELLKPFSDDAPCGEDLEYSGEIEKLRLLMTGERRAVGDDIERNLPAAKDFAIELLSSSSKDLRVAAMLAKAALAVGGLAGFRDGMQVLRALLEDQWDAVYPRIDPVDNDPITRRFAIEDLNDGSTILLLEQIPEIAANFADCDDTQRDSLEALLRDVKQSADEIEASFNKRFADGDEQKKQISLFSLTKKLDESLDILDQLKPEQPLQTEDTPPGAPSPTPSAYSVNGAITSRQQVEAALDRITNYYREKEPASPVPVLISLSKKLIRKDFFEVFDTLPKELITELKKILDE